MVDGDARVEHFVDGIGFAGSGTTVCVNGRNKPGNIDDVVGNEVDPWASFDGSNFCS